MNPVYAAALELQAFCSERGWRFCFIGGPLLELKGDPDAWDRLRRLLAEIP